MKRKPIKIDWDGLDEAFNNQNEELVYYLDLVTGHVVLEGEGEEDDFDEDEGRYEPTAAAAPVGARNDATRLYVDTPTTDQKIEWLISFLDEVRELDAAAAAQLREALTEDDPVPRIKQVLEDNPDVRDRWFLYRSERLHDRIDEWLAAAGVAAVEPPPWSG